jgi:hypothetical protein
VAEYGIQTVPDGMPADPGNADKIAPTVTEAIAAGMQRLNELHSDTYGQGSTIGDVMPVANVTPDLDPGVGTIDSFDQKPGVEG